MEKRKKLINNFLLVFFTTVFISLIVIIKTGNIESFDTLFYKMLPKSNSINNFMKFITMFGDYYTFIIITILLLLKIKSKKINIFIILNLLLSSSINELIKNIIQRVRPEGINLVIETGYSFPSGHTMISFAFYGFLIYLSNKYLKNKKIKISILISLLLLILLIGLSRVYLGVHYISDVIGGLALSYLYLYFFIKIFKRFTIKK